MALYLITTERYLFVKYKIQRLTMKKLILSIVAILTCAVLFSQQPTFNWIKNFTYGDFRQRVYEIEGMPNGDIIATRTIL